MHENVRTLLDTLELEKLEENLFRGTSPDNGWQRVFGGQVVAQALVAAQNTVAQDRHVHSLHGYFIRPGDPTIPIVYEVARLRDGGSFTTRVVTGIQHGEAIFTLSASFQRPEKGLEHQATMPKVPGPDDIIGQEELTTRILESAPDAVRHYWMRPRPIEFRPVSFEHYLTGDKLPPAQNVWVRCLSDIGDDPKLNAAVLAYLSDMTLLDTSLFAHGMSIFDRRVQAASLDHAMWFHRPFRVSEWLLYTQDSPSSSGGRGLTRGSLFSADGTLVASVAQEGLIRLRQKSQPDV
ncbi:acyl-CoA thioesterase II [Aureimonas fodinaquatilis]|uniref:Acyl-CoA thioesterase 2 n=1 Tax=Aureimonas fodinaquatilis TaxID=2565783 RepID=A0A5B0DT62_9HYPH|nr:acyl-CoA thioesterase II [Aureimonas fodinaquatilis]KAA0969666.1 acyl-CoA thioesterase II [Aureimonas fodinaquatilis]